MLKNRIEKQKMKDIKRNFIMNPSKKTLIIFTFFWFLGIALLTLSTTDLFTESFFQKKYLIIYFLMIGSTITTTILHIIYWKNKKLNSNSNTK